MAIAHDTATLAQAGGWTTTPDPKTWSHAGASSGVKGVIVFLTAAGASTDQITSVSYGGVSMSRIATNGFSVDSAGEPGTSYCYFLGASVPQGTQTVSVDHTATTNEKYGCSITVTGAYDTFVAASNKRDGDIANPQWALDSGARTAIRYAHIYSGLGVVGNVAPLANMSALVSEDMGAFLARTDRETTPSSGSTTVGWTSTSDDVAAIGVAIAEAPTVVTLTSATETDTAQALSFTKPIRKTLTVGAEADAAQIISFTQSGGGTPYDITPAVESDVAQPFSFTKTIYKTLTAAVETSTAQPLSVTHIHYRTLSPVTETDLAQVLTFTKTIYKTLGVATEIDLATALTILEEGGDLIVVHTNQAHHYYYYRSGS